MDCPKLYKDIERLESLRDQFSNQLRDSEASGRGKIALFALSHEASNTADEILEHYAKDLIEQDEKDEEHPNIEFIKTLKERLGYITDDTTIDQIRNNITRYLKHDLSLSSNLLTYALKEKSADPSELDSIFQQLNLEPDKISEIMERIKNLEVLETENYIFMLPKDKWEEGKRRIPNPDNNPDVPEYIAPSDLTAILKKPVYYDWSYETDGRKTKNFGKANNLVYDEKWIGKEIRHFPWSKELIQEANEKLLKPNGYHIPESWKLIVDSLISELAREKGVRPNDIRGSEKPTALRERLGLAFSGRVWEGSLHGAGSYGYFWYASESSRADAYFFVFNSDRVTPESCADRVNAYSVRCVSSF